jgi:exonuclease III
MAKFLMVAQWNANGLHPHIDEVKLFLKHNYIDVMLISETHCTDRTYCSISQYNIYYTNHPDVTAHTGTAIIIRQSISHYELPSFQLDYLQATSVNVTLLPFDLTISAVYCPPKHNIKVQHFTEFFKTLGPKFIVGGDYNSKHTEWGARTTTTKGRGLLKVIEQKYDVLSTATPTHWPTDSRKTPDLLDLFITRGLSESYLAITASYELSSDHSPIMATVSESIITKPLPPHLQTRTTNWIQYKELFQQGTNLNMSLKTSNDIETATNTFITLLQDAEKKATLPTTRDVQTVSIPVELKQLIAEKRKARARWQRTHYPDDKLTFHRLSHKLKKKLKEIR